MCTLLATLPILCVYVVFMQFLHQCLNYWSNSSFTNNPTMADFVEEKLIEWNLSEYIQKFKDEQIDKHVFLNMPESMIKELIPLIGKRFSFLENRKTLFQTEDKQTEDKQTESSNISDKLEPCESDDTISIASSSSMSSFYFSHGKILKDLLSKSSCGKQILTQTRLTFTDRSKICHLIIDKLLCHSTKITSQQFEEWAQEIAALFKYEKASTYYVPSNTKFKRLASGKLWDKYNNLKKYIKKHEKVIEKDTELIPDCEDILLQLRAIQPDDANLQNLWKETFHARNKGTSIINYYEEYPILKTSIGISLLQIDFEIETGINGHIFLKKWPEIAVYVLQLAKKREVCPSLCELENDIPLETLSLFILPYLFQSCNVKTGNKKKWKPSKIESAESFICRVPNIAELEPKLEKRKEKLQSFGLTLQPMVLTVGSIVNLTSFYVIINDVKYTSTSLMNAVNMCFQTFFALDAKYSVESEMVWYFLQYYVYGITSEKYNRNFISVDTTWHDLQELMFDSNSIE